MENALQHHGILGMRWGIRRYQNEDGTLTPAGRRHIERQDDRWIKQKSDKIHDRTQSQVSKDLVRYQKELMRDTNAVNKSGKLSSTTINAYNRRMVDLMNERVSGLTSPSGRIVQFVAKRGEIGVHMALAGRDYDMSQLKNGIWNSGRIAYKKKTVDMA